MNHVLLFCGSTKFKEKKRQSYKLVLIVVILKILGKTSLKEYITIAALLNILK